MRGQGGGGGDRREEEGTGGAGGAGGGRPERLEGACSPQSARNCAEGALVGCRRRRCSPCSSCSLASDIGALQELGLRQPIQLRPTGSQQAGQRLCKAAG